jgi:hypothetical protein
MRSFIVSSSSKRNLDDLPAPHRAQLSRNARAYAST